MENDDPNRVTEVEHEIVLRGVTICPGVGIGTVRLVDQELDAVKYVLQPAQVLGEQKRYRLAVTTIGERLRQHIEQYHEGSASQSSALLRAHEMMLNDEEFHGHVAERIALEHMNAEWAVEEEGKSLVARFEKMRNPYFQARAEDIRDLVSHILRTLSHQDRMFETAPVGLTQRRVTVTGHLYPSDVVLAEHNDAPGFATESSAFTSHAALLLRGFGIPAIGGLAALKQVAEDGDTIIVDATAGIIILRPGSETLESYSPARQVDSEISAEISQPAPCATRDGTRIGLLANIENPRQVVLAFENGLEGIGLFRTEFLVLLSDTFPTEEEQHNLYSQVIQNANNKMVTIRTFDIGADKQRPTLHECSGQNPALGVRGLRRHLLRCPEELRTQMRAILRAAVEGDVRILLPMVTTIDDVQKAKQHLETVKAELRTERVAFNADVKLGAMIEVPAAAIETRAILALVDFVSVGSNDLLQYFVGADRDNEEVLHYNDACQNAFRWLLRFIIDEAGAIERQDDVMVCGEIASRPDIVPDLLHLGYRVLSIAPVSAPVVREAVANTDLNRTNRQP